MTMGETQNSIQGESEYPTGVKDRVAYDDYVAIRKHPLFTDKRMIEASDGTSLDLATGLNFLRKQIEHLEEGEKKIIMAKAQAVTSLKGKMATLKKKAFGIKQNGLYSMGEGILDPKKGELLELFGRMHSIAEVHKIVTVEWGYNVSIQTIDNFRKKHIEIIRTKQEEYQKSYSDIRLGHKRSRLDELSFLYNDRKQRYEESRAREDYKLLLQTIEQIRKEVEGDTLIVSGGLEINVQATINTHIQMEMMRQLSINDIIIGRISARLGVNGSYLINRLHSSYYSKFSGFKPVEGGLDDMPIYPSAIIYNFDEIKAKNDAIKRSEEETKKLIVPSAEELPRVLSSKEKLLAAIKAKKKDIDDKLDDINIRESI